VSWLSCLGTTSIGTHRSLRAPQRIITVSPMRAVVASVCVGIVLSAATVSSGAMAASAPLRPQVRAETIISASRPAFVSVEIPPGAGIACPDGTDVTVGLHGGGAAVAVVIARADGSPGAIVAVRLPPSEGSDVVVTRDNGRAACDHGVLSLASGTYNVFVNPGGQPVLVRLLFTRVNGTASLAATRAVSWNLALWQPSVAADPQFSAGANGSLGDAGVTWVGTWTSVTSSAVQSLGVCRYVGDTTAGRYRSGCPGPSVTTSAPLGGANIVFGASRGHGAFGLGGYVTTIGLQTSAGVAAFWLTYPR
jgi:hypothetical protein